MSLADELADMYSAFAGLGLEAFEGTYQAPDSASTVPCTVLVDQPQIVRDGSSGPDLGLLTEVTMLRAQVPSPQRGGRLVFNGTTWRLDDPLGGVTLAESKWTVIRDRA